MRIDAAKIQALAAALTPLLAMAAQTTGTDEPRLTWARGPQGRSVHVQLRGAPQSSYVLFFTDVADGDASPPYQQGRQGPNSPAYESALPWSASIAAPMSLSRRAGRLDRTGFALESIPLEDPALLGLTWRAMFLETRGTASLLSNDIRFTVPSPGTTHPVRGPAIEVLRGQSTTTLDDGRIFVAGGLNARHEPVSTWHLFDPRVQEFTLSGAMPTPRAHHSVTLLQDGRLLLLGGLGASAQVRADGVLFDPEQNSFEAVPDMSAARVLHTATPLRDGRVFVAGGSAAYTPSHPIGFPRSALGSLHSSTEVFDPRTIAWATGPSLPAPLTAHQASEGPGGRVLITGGISLESEMRGTTDACVVFDPATSNLIPVDSLPHPLAFHAQTSTSSGGCLVAGGATLDFELLALVPSRNVFHHQLHGIGDVNSSWNLSGTLPDIIVDGCCVCIDRTIYACGGGFQNVELTGASASFGHPATSAVLIDGQFRVVTHLGTLQGRPGCSEPIPQPPGPPAKNWQLLFVGNEGTPGVAGEILTLPIR